MSKAKDKISKQNSKWLRVFLPAFVVIAWVVAAGLGGPYFGKLGDVSSNDLATFLPSSAESTSVKDEMEKFIDTSTIPAIVIFESSEKLTNKQTAEIEKIRSKLGRDENISGDIDKAVKSEDERAALLVLPIDSESKFQESVPVLQKIVADAKPSTNYKFTGPAMFNRDLNKAFAGIDSTLLIVALAVVFVILLAVYRSPVLPVVTLLGAVIALASAILLVWHLANAGIVQLNGQVQGILFILVIGTATDYSLLYIARYREELMRHSSPWKATIASWNASFEPVVAAGGTVSLGLLCLLASDLGSNQSLGPVAGIGVAFSVLIALTFLPAALLLFGRAAFWPRRPKYVPQKKQTDYHDTHPAWSRVGALVSKHPRRIWVGTLGLLLLACVAIPQLKAEGVSQDNLIIGASEARDGQSMIDRHFPKGAGSPAYILTPKNNLNSVVDLLDSDRGIDGVSAVARGGDIPQLPLGKKAKEIRSEIREEVAAERKKQLSEAKSAIETQMAGLPNDIVDQAYQQAVSNVPSVDELVEKADPFKGVEPKVDSDKVLVQATLTDVASSIEARQTIQRLRDNLKKHDSGTMIGGVSAIQLDTNTAADRDIVVVMPLILLAITAVLMVLLRSIVAPLVLLLTTVVSFGATIGIAALLFNNVWHFPGADPSVIIFAFVFLVALGIDYNIFLMTRVREETIKLGLRTGTLKSLVVTGGVITSAGVVLAATFAALYVIPILFLVQIAFIVAFGVLLDTMIVRSLLVPALTLEIGKKIWWPSKLARKGKS